MTDSQRAGWAYALEHAPRSLLKKIDRSALAIWVCAEDYHRQANQEQAALGRLLVKTEKNGVTVQSPYQLWQQSGYIHAAEGRTIDYGYVATRLGEFAARHRIEGIAFDRWGIERFIAAADAVGVGLWLRDKPSVTGTGIAMVPWGQGFKDMGPAVEALEDALLESGLRHGNHPVLTWNAASAVLQQDPAGSRKFAKNKSTGRIDGVVALAMALALAKQSPTTRSVYEERGLVTI